MLRNLVVEITVLFIAVGCYAVAPSKVVPHGIIKTEGVTITSEDGAPFVLKSGEMFNTPFSYNVFFFERDSEFSLPLRHALDFCRAVRVKIPGRDKPLYGALHFSNMDLTASGPGSRTYLIEIPDRYIQEATDGRASVVYELVETEHGAQAGWVLWLSDMPLRGYEAATACQVH